ncbi:MAG: phosphodiester glycosidase family protein [Chloroflexi bacterium]|nr:phosphodiester glycosidase family protein [Chloroflexota bacterium]
MRIFLFLVLTMLAGCTALAPPLASPSPNAPGLTPLPSTPSPAATAAPAQPARGAWRKLWPGAQVLETEDGVYALRHRPRAARFDHRFESNPARGDFLSGWLDKAPQAQAAVNCGFYWNDEGVYRHIGLLTTNGKIESKLRRRWGGVFIVRDGNAFVVPQPRKLLAPAAIGVQGWPMLVFGAAIVPDLDAETAARRTAVGVDKAGRVVWATAPRETTLDAWAQRLLQPDLALVEAVNLDGGASTGLRWRQQPEGAQKGPDSFPIPCVILLAPTK